jgi:hypothetical protein
MQEKEKETTSITTQICFVILFGCLFLAAGFSFETNRTVQTLNEKMKVRDSLILRMEQHQERQDSIMFYYLDKWIDKMYKK